MRKQRHLPVIYIAGKYTAPTSYEVKQNIQRAEALGMKVATIGAMPLIPHCNTSHWEGLKSDEWFYKGTLALLNKCDAMVVEPKYVNSSSGTLAEIEFADRVGKQWFWGNKKGLEEFKEWLHYLATYRGIDLIE